MGTAVSDLFKRTRVGAGLVVVVAGLLVSGFAWRGASAQASQAAKEVAAQAATPPIAHAIAGSRDSYADIVKVVSPAVVTIRTEGKVKASPTDFQGDDLLRRFFGDQFGDGGGRQARPRTFKQRALGSGVIVSRDGYILTNYHVVDGADQIHVDLKDGRTLDAKLVGTDKPSDLALIKIGATDLKALSLGDSDAVQVGDVVLAVGNPLGIGQTVTMGIVSAKGRSTSVGDGSYEDFLQTDAPINHGNSGGALVDTRGELVGINSQILSNSDGNIGIGFAIPSNMARNVMDQLRTKGHVTRAQLGVHVQAVTSDMAKSLGLSSVDGAIVASVEPGSAADHAGLKQGDVIESFNGQPVHDTNTLRNHVAESQPGASATLKVVRDGSERTVTAKLDEASAGDDAGQSAESGDDQASLGVSVEPLTPELANRVGAPKGLRGVVIDEVSPDGRAADAGLQSGDVIEEVNRQPIRSVDQLRTAVRSGSNKPLLLLVSRQGNDIFVTVPAGDGH